MNKLCFILGIVLILFGCSRYATNGEHLYLQSRNGPSLEVPPPLSRANISTFYDLPQQDRDARVSVVPPR